MRQWQKKIFLWMLLCVVPACEKKKSLSSRATHKKKSMAPAFSRDQITIQEAKFSDIPSPLNAVPLTPYYQAEEGNALFAYSSVLSVDELMRFYAHEMERLGWRMAFAFSGYESMLQFEKPGRVCIVSIRPQRQPSHTEWVIATGPAIEAT